MKRETNIEKRQKVIMPQSWWQGLTPEQRKFISTIAIGLGVSLVSAAIIYFGVKVYQKQVSKHELNKSFGGNVHATWANQIHNAINNNGLWLGTDVVSLRKTMREIPSKQDFEKVQKSYRQQFQGASLPDDLRGDLSTTEYDEMMAIMDSKPDKSRDAKGGIVIYDPHGWAKRLNAAFNYSTWGFMWGTDEDAITAVFLEMPSQKAFLDTAETYQSEYGVSLVNAMAGELSIHEIGDFMTMIKKKPSR